MDHGQTAQLERAHGLIALLSEKNFEQQSASLAVTATSTFIYQACLLILFPYDSILPSSFLLLFLNKQGRWLAVDESTAEVRQYGLLGERCAMPADFHQCCFSDDDPPVFFDLTLIDYEHDTETVGIRTSFFADQYFIFHLFTFIALFFYHLRLRPSRASHGQMVTAPSWKAAV